MPKQARAVRGGKAPRGGKAGGPESPRDPGVDKQPLPYLEQYDMRKEMMEDSVFPWWGQEQDRLLEMEGLLSDRKWKEWRRLMYRGVEPME